MKATYLTILMMAIILFSVPVVLSQGYTQRFSIGSVYTVDNKYVIIVSHNCKNDVLNISVFNKDFKLISQKIVNITVPSCSWPGITPYCIKVLGNLVIIAGLTKICVLTLPNLTTIYTKQGRSCTYTRPVIECPGHKILYNETITTYCYLTLVCAFTHNNTLTLVILSRSMLTNVGPIPQHITIVKMNLKGKILLNETLPYCANIVDAFKLRGDILLQLITEPGLGGHVMTIRVIEISSCGKIIFEKDFTSSKLDRLVLPIFFFNNTAYLVNCNGSLVYIYPISVKGLESPIVLHVPGYAWCICLWLGCQMPSIGVLSEGKSYCYYTIYFINTNKTVTLKFPRQVTTCCNGKVCIVSPNGNITVIHTHAFYYRFPQNLSALVLGDYILVSYNNVTYAVNTIYYNYTKVDFKGMIISGYPGYIIGKKCIIMFTNKITVMRLPVSLNALFSFAINNTVILLNSTNLYVINIHPSNVESNNYVISTKCITAYSFPFKLKLVYCCDYLDLASLIHINNKVAIYIRCEKPMYLILINNDSACVYDLHNISGIFTFDCNIYGYNSTAVFLINGGGYKLVYHVVSSSANNVTLTVSNTSTDPQVPSYAYQSFTLPMAISILITTVIILVFLINKVK